MNGSYKPRLRTTAASVAIASALAASINLIAAPPVTPGKPATTTPTTNPVKLLLADELNQLDRDIASRMIRRADYPPARRGRLELEIDLRILHRAVVSTAADARFETNEQAAAWLRARQFRDALRSFEEAKSQDTNPPTPSQQEAVSQLHKLSYSPTGASDDFCRTAALALANAVNPSPVPPNALPAMRPRPASNADTAKDRPPALGELTDEVHRLAAISGPLRQQLLNLAALASAEKDDKTLTTLLAQSVALAKGLQSNTAVGPEARIGIETQLAEGIVLFTDPRTRDAGKTRIESLGQYRQTLSRIGKLNLSREQTDQLAPAFTWAQANPDAGPRLLATVEQYFDACARWDALPTNVVALPTPVRRAFDDVRTQFTRVRGAFLQEASRVGSPGGTPASLDAQVEDAKRLCDVADDLLTTPASLDTLNGLKPRPAGALEKKIATAATSAATPTFAATRSDGQRYLDAVHTLATLTRDLAAKPLSEIPAPVAQAWAGGRLDAFDHRWRGLAADLATTLAAGATDLDAPKFARLQVALKLNEALRTAAQLEAALGKAAPLSRWADWSIDPAALHAVLAPYKEATTAAFLGFASDNPDAVDKWQHLSTRYQPLVALILRDAPYADQCQSLPIGVVADTARLATPFDNAPFATERFASYAVTVWAHFEKTGNDEQADRLSTTLARRLARDLKLDLKIEDTPPRKKK
jgi:hypothetical protein